MVQTATIITSGTILIVTIFILILFIFEYNKCERENNCKDNKKLKIFEIVLIIIILLIAIAGVIVSFFTGNTVTENTKKALTVEEENSITPIVTTNNITHNELYVSTKNSSSQLIDPIYDTTCKSGNINENPFNSTSHGNDLRDLPTCINTNKANWIDGGCFCFTGYCGTLCQLNTYGSTLYAIGNTVESLSGTYVSTGTSVTFGGPMADFPINTYTGAYGFLYTSPTGYYLFNDYLKFETADELNSVVPYNTNINGLQNVFLVKEKQEAPYFTEGVIFTTGNLNVETYRYWVPENNEYTIFIEKDPNLITQVNNSIGYNHLINNVLKAGGVSTKVTISRYNNLANSVVYIDGNTSSFSNDFTLVDTFYVRVEDA